MLTSMWYTPLSKQTHISPLCAHSMGYLDIKTKLSSLISGPHVLLTHWGLVTVWQQNFGHHCFNQWRVPSMVPSEYPNQLLPNINETYVEKICDISIKIQKIPFRIFNWICHMHNGTHLVQASMWSGSTLVKVTASCLFSTKPLPDLLLTGSLGIHSKVI